MKNFWILLFSCCLAFSVTAKVREMVVKTSVADIRALNEKTGKISALSLDDLSRQHKKKSKVYQKAPSIFGKDNPGLLSQVLFGERVLVEQWNDEWCKVQIPSQKIFYEESWQPCFGFIRADCLTDQFEGGGTSLIVAVPWACLYKKEQKLQRVERLLSLGTYLVGIQKKGAWWIVNTSLGKKVIAADDVVVIDENLEQDLAAVRQSIISTAKLFLGGPYIWGGGSAWKEHALRIPNSLKRQVTGVDCSNLTYLSYRAHGLLIPRNSHSQWLAADPLDTGDNLQPGDVIFFADAHQRPLHMNHVVMYAGVDAENNDLIIESNGRIQPFGVRVIATKDCARLGNKPVKQLSNKQEICWQCGGKDVKEVIYLGTFLANNKAAGLRREFLRVMRGDLSVP